MICIVTLACSCNEVKTNNKKQVTDNTPIPTEATQVYHQAISLLGDTLYAAAPSEAMMEKYITRQKTYLSNKESLEDLIWYGRFTAYTGDYKGAIDLYSEGLKKWPNESRLLRHRGHRYISLREFDKAITDLSRAAQLIEGQKNQIEEDGMPNAQNVPVSTRHGNIYYHLGLAHYLKGDMEAAKQAYIKALLSSENQDNLVSTTHWLYMIFRRLGETKKAETILLPISKELIIIENQSYHNACLFYKQMLTLDEVYKPDDEANPSNSAIKYAIGNWYYYNGDLDKASQIFRGILEGDDWSSFGYIAAEADLAKMQEAL
jgi:tetratricopeptide (TPR) repeat protein